MLERPLIIVWIASAACLVGGCGWHDGAAGLHGGGPPVLFAENPMFLPVADHEFLHNQLVDAVDDYFRIEREERVRLVGNTMTEGRIESLPLTGATILEPWHRDSTKGFERRQSTLQSIRRRAVVRITPAEGGFLVDLAVYKELEDLDRPEFGSIGGATFRHDGTLVREADRVEGGPVTLGWIPLGRDMSLEQQMLSDLRQRVGY